MIESRQQQLPSGMPVITLPLAGTSVATALVVFNAGSHVEAAPENGLAHFLEHMAFKGGADFPSSRAIVRCGEGLGADLNAFTTSDMVGFHLTVRASRLKAGVELLTDFTARPALAARETDREREVVLQEISLFSEQPAQVANDLLSRAAYGDHPLGRPVLGTAATVSGFAAGQLHDFRRRNWLPANGAFVLAGDLSAIQDRELARLLSRYRGAGEAVARANTPAFTPRTLVRETDAQQSHLRLYYRLAQFAPGNRHWEAALQVYSTLLGGSMGSRLFEELRDQRGLCYTVSANDRVRPDAGEVAIGAVVGSARAGEAFARTTEIVVDLRQRGPQSEEVARAKAYCIGSYLRHLERSAAVAGTAAARLMITGQTDSPSTLVAAIEAVEVADVAQIAELMPISPAVAVVGPHAPSDFSSAG